MAKKIQLEGLKKPEIEASHQEAKVLKDLKHPNIGIFYFYNFSWLL